MIINLEGGELKITSCTKMYQCTKMYNAEADTTMDNIVTAPVEKTIHSFLEMAHWGQQGKHKHRATSPFSKLFCEGTIYLNMGFFD